MEEVAEGRCGLNEMAKVGSILRGGRKLLWEEDWDLKEKKMGKEEWLLGG